MTLLGRQLSLLEKERKNSGEIEMDERDKKYPEPPAYYKQFAQGTDAMEPPDLSRLSKKDYFILY